MRTQLLGANTTSSENRNNKTETTKHNTEFSFYVIRCHFGPLLFALVFAPPSCIGVRTLHLSRHLASVFAPCIFLVCLSDGRTGSLFFTMSGMPRPTNRFTRPTDGRGECRGATEIVGPKGEYRILYVRVAVQKPLLYARDSEKIALESLGLVTARVRFHEGEKKLKLQIMLGCSEDLLYDAIIRALGLIHANSLPEKPMELTGGRGG